MDRIELTVDPDENKARLEDFLCLRFRSLSKMYLRDVVKTGGCEVNGRDENIGYRLRWNDFVEINVDLSREHSMLPQDIRLDVIYEDADLIVVNKPSGMLVHPSHREKTGTLLNALAYYLNIQASAFVRPGLVHRLDKGTSGLVVVAKNLRSHRVLASHFQRKLVTKQYLALVDGIVAENSGTITGNIGRYPEEKRWDLKAGGKPSETRYRVRERRGNNTLVELEPVTGRTNQLRIHCASIGHPIAGDARRGGSENQRLCLHAARLSFRHPSSGDLIELHSPMPDWLNASDHGSRP